MNDKDFFKGQLGQLSEEGRKVAIELLRNIWDYYDENYSFAVFDQKDERVEFLQEVFLNPLQEATDEIAEEIGYESSKQRLQRQLSEIAAKRKDKKEDDGSIPF